MDKNLPKLLPTIENFHLKNKDLFSPSEFTIYQLFSQSKEKIESFQLKLKNTLKSLHSVLKKEKSFLSLNEYEIESILENKNNSNNTKQFSSVNWLYLINDTLIEKTEKNLKKYQNCDERTSKQINGSVGKIELKNGKKTFSAKIVPPPQLCFKKKIDNARSTKFIPPLKTKPNSQRNLKSSIFLQSDGTYSHPYQNEILDLKFNWDVSLFGETKENNSQSQQILLNQKEKEKEKDIEIEQGIGIEKDKRKGNQKEKEKDIENEQEQEKENDIENDIEIEQEQEKEKEIENKQEIEKKNKKRGNLIFINNSELFDNLIQQLKTQNKIQKRKNKNHLFLDVINHSKRSFQGFICLFLLKQNENVWIIDALKLRERMGELNEFTTNPEILKIIFNGKKVIKWIQRDFGMYLVNCCDLSTLSKWYFTFKNDPICQNKNIFQQMKKTLLFIEKKNGNGNENKISNENKEFDEIDWRIRPLPREVLNCSSDRIEKMPKLLKSLISKVRELNNEKNSLLEIWELQKSLTLLKYKKPIFSFENSKRIYLKKGLKLPKISKLIFFELFDWRDQYARENDESPNWVMDDESLINISKKAPEKIDQLLNCCNNQITNAIRLESITIIRMIAKAKKKIKKQQEEKQKLKLWEGRGVSMQRETPHLFDSSSGNESDEDIQLQQNNPIYTESGLEEIKNNKYLVNDITKSIEMEQLQTGRNKNSMNIQEKKSPCVPKNENKQLAKKNQEIEIGTNDNKAINTTTQNKTDGNDIDRDVQNPNLLFSEQIFSDSMKWMKTVGWIHNKQILSGLISGKTKNQKKKNDQQQMSFIGFSGDETNSKIKDNIGFHTNTKFTISFRKNYNNNKMGGQYIVNNREKRGGINIGVNVRGGVGLGDTGEGVKIERSKEYERKRKFNEETRRNMFIQNQINLKREMEKHNKNYVENQSQSNTLNSGTNEQYSYSLKTIDLQEDMEIEEGEISNI
ncbi:exosome component [Anaeramoeba flamelloides]|uniref:Exosome component n=1 Tax=Anaeramoeba flamelloides TaxID=1746091 RepID=A0AAV7Z742_9EUKA|nr:exosome component [Anaeramoeba flamelloides]